MRCDELAKNRQEPRVSLEALLYECPSHQNILYDTVVISNVEFILGEKTISISQVQGAAVPVTASEILKSHKIPNDVVAFKVGEQLFDLHMNIPSEATKAVLITSKTPEGVDVIRHSCAHILAHAVKRLYPKTQVTIGPVIETGFFYDFSKEGGFKEEDLQAIEVEMKRIVKARFPIRREVWPVAKALVFFKGQGEDYKCEIIEDLARDSGVTEVSVYWHGEEFVDLCRGPHVQNTGAIPALKLTHVAGAYWRGDEKNEMLSRIYGTAFASEEDLKAYLHQIEEAKRRDHRRIGVDQKLFSFHQEAPAAPFFHPNGAFLYAQIQEFLRDLNRANGFQEVISPLVMSQELWHKSGHYDNYRENMYFTKIDERDFAIKPMNCPGHCLIYGSDKHSYRELPIRFAEFGRVHRHERSGVTAGLFRVRSFVQDDAHVFCSEDQIESEIRRILGMVKSFYTVFGFEYRVELSTRPEKSIGSDEVWQKAEEALANALKADGMDFKVNPGDGAFYGPKIDFHLKDSIGRTHQCGTVQLDFSMPSRFDLEYSGADNKSHNPVMIHRAIAGSLERFLGIYIEHVAGIFPFWMAPKQAVVMTLAEEAHSYGEEVFAAFKRHGYRVTFDDSSDKLSAKIKKYQPFKVPYLIIIGAREAQEQVVSIRHPNNQQRQGVKISELLAELESQARPVISSLS